MWYSLYFLASMLTSFLESTSVLTKIIDQNMHGNDRALETSREILTSSVSRYISDLPDFSKFTTTITEKKSTSVLTKIINQNMHGNDRALETSGEILTSSVSRYISDLPDFSKFTKTISEMKCMEYVYEMLKRQEDKNLQHSYSDSEDVSIINGREVKEAEFPHMGALGWWSWVEGEQKLVFLCGATLISDSFMLTAAHCTIVIRRGLVHREPYLVRLGTRYLRNSPRELPTDVIIRYTACHPYYQPLLKHFDIALVKLAERVSFNKYIQPACLSSRRYQLTSDRKLTATGWGAVRATRNGQSMSNELRSVQVHVIDRQKCNELLEKKGNRNWRGLQPHQMCAGELDGNADTCQGDSGGPLQYLLVNTTSEGNIHRILSITSYGLTGCAKQNAPGIYTDISYYSIMDWIESTVWPYQI